MEKAKRPEKYLVQDAARLKRLRSDPKTWPQVILKELRYRAKKVGMAFDLGVDDLVVPAVCPVLGIPITLGTGKRMLDAPGAPSVDRFDNGKGYTKDNVRIISNRANIIKGNATLQELRSVVQYLEAGHGA